MEAMRILFVVPSHPEPSQTFIVREAQALGAVICTERLREDFPLPGGVETVVIPRAGSFFDGRSMRGRLRIAWNFVRRRNVDVMPGAEERAFQGLLRERKPGVVLAHYGIEGLRVERACRREGVPFVVHFHGFDLSSLYRHAVYRHSCRRMLTAAAGTVAVNSVQRQRLLALGCPPERIAFIPYGVPVDQFTPSTCQGEQPCRFLAVGRLVPKKAPLLTLRAFARCAAECPGARLILIGDGPLREKVERTVRDLGVAGCVTLAGAVPNERVREEMGRAGVFLQHSVTAPNGDEEGWPVAVAEAAACGLPIVATRHAGIPEQVVEGETGFLVEEGDWEAMAGKMVLLARDPAKRQAMGLAGRRHIEEHGDVRRSIELLGAALRSYSRPEARATNGSLRDPGTDVRTDR